MTVLDKIFLNFVFLLHLSLILFTILTPFYGSNYFLILNSVTIPFIMFHWILNENTCALTMIEDHIRCKITGKPIDKESSFIRKIVEPVYDFKMNNNQFASLIYIVTFSIWLYNTYVLYNKYINFNGTFDKFISS